MIKDELILKLTNGMINDRQHGFRAAKNLCKLFGHPCDSLDLSLNENIRTDLICFDFVKSFDSVEYDLILLNLKNKLRIYRRFLKFIADYLRDRQQQWKVFVDERRPVCHT
jgi:hypothetical protein